MRSRVLLAAAILSPAVACTMAGARGGAAAERPVGFAARSVFPEPWAPAAGLREAAGRTRTPRAPNASPGIPTPAVEPASSRAAADAAQGSPGMVHPGTSVRRDLCLSISVGPGAAYECGDLRLVHALPTARVLNAARTPVLVYNSAHARPAPVFSFNLQMVAGSIPSSVTAIVRVGPVGGPLVQQATKSWPDPGWSQGGPWRFSVGYDASAQATGVYAYQVEVLGAYGGMQSLAVYTGEMVVVNRSGSPLGTGWGLAGVEQLHWLSDGGRALVVGGDGSTRVYAPAAPNILVAQAVDRPDTLHRATVGGEPHAYRRLPNGSRVWYDPAGRHYATITRVGHRTGFDYDVLNRVIRIQLPSGAAGLSGGAYILTYDDQTGGGRLASVCAMTPGGACRTTTLQYALGGRRVTGITDPDGTRVQFGYQGAEPLVRSRKDRRSATTAFAYDPALRLSEASLPVAAAGYTIRQGFSAAETAGWSASVPAASAYTAYDGPRTDVADHTHFWVDRWGAPTRIRDALGYETSLARGDARFPALVTRVDAPGGLATLAWYNARGNADSTKVLDPLGDGRNAVTRYTYDDAWPDFLARTVLPTGEVAEADYDAQTGNRLWQQVGPSITRRVHFGYNGLGQVTTIQEPGAATPTRLYYDPVMGNLEQVFTPLGHQTVYYGDGFGRDTLVRSQIEGSLFARQLTRYKPGTDLVEYARSDAPAINGAPAQAVEVTNTYDEEGNLRSLSRVPIPDDGGAGPVSTTWRYDVAGRKVAEVNGPGIDSTTYDPAGNPVAHRTRRGSVIHMQYDALGRLTQRVLPSVTYERVSCIPHAQPLGCGSRRFPFYASNSAGGLVIPADTATFQYDAMGRMLAAHNRDARVSRTYYPGGLLRTDTLRIRRYVPYDVVTSGGGGPGGGIVPTSTGPGTPTQVNGRMGHPYAPPRAGGGVTIQALPGEPYPDGDFTAHVYGLQYTYDLSGRRTVLGYPANLAPTGSGAGTTATYGYDPETGELRTVTDVFGRQYGFSYDARGRPIGTTFPGQGQETRGYDDDGRLTSRYETAQSGTVMLHQYALGYDARGKVLSVTGGTASGAQQIETRYSGLGMVVSTDWSRGGTAGRLVEQYQVDALENVQQKFERSPLGVETTSRQEHLPGTHQLRAVYGERVLAAGGGGIYVQDPDTLHQRYDQAGQVRFGVHRRYTTTNSQNGLQHNLAYWMEAASFYGADDKLHVYQQYEQSAGSGWRGTGTYEEHRYDALGRRVLSRAREDDLDLCAEDCVSTITRYVWDGDQLLHELKANGAHSLTQSALQHESSSGRHTGKVLYTHGGGLDQPLGVYREGYANEYGWAGIFLVVPHVNWRGRFDAGTYPAGVAAGVDDRWPGEDDRVFHNGGGSTGRGDWLGGLLNEQMDASGLMYRRNRYYDPQTGRFTQEDPIGIAGGLNVYGYAAGDPVSYSDPYGLSATCNPPTPECVVMGHLRAAWDGLSDRADATRRWLVREGTIQLATMGAGTTLRITSLAAREARILQPLSTRMFNQLKSVDSRHLEIARRELRGVVTGWDHVTEVREAAQGLRNTITSLRGFLQNPNISDDARRFATDLLRRASRGADRAERALSP